MRRWDKCVAEEVAVGDIVWDGRGVELLGWTEAAVLREGQWWLNREVR